MICDLRTIPYCFSADVTPDLFRSVLVAMNAIPCQPDGASEVTTEVGAGQLSQGCRWTRLLFIGLPMLNPHWIINATLVW